MFEALHSDLLVCIIIIHRQIADVKKPNEERGFKAVLEKLLIIA